MLAAIKSLHINQEITCYRTAGIERRVRRTAYSLYQVYDINWLHRQCWHVSYEIGAVIAWRAARYNECVFRARGAFAAIVKAPRAHGYQSKQNILLKQHVFHDAKRRAPATAEAPRLVAIAGGLS